MLAGHVSFALLDDLQVLEQLLGVEVLLEGGLEVPGFRLEVVNSPLEVVDPLHEHFVIGLGQGWKFCRF